MAFSNNNLNNSRGLDSHAMNVLDFRKKKRQEKDQNLRKQKAEREINSLRARLAVIDREIERLSVTERRSRSEIVKTEQDFKKEINDVLSLTRELSEHESKIKKIESMLGLKQGAISRLKSVVSRSSHTEDREIGRLKDELSRIEKEIEQLNNKRKRIISEMSVYQHKVQKESELESRISAEFHENESEISKLMQELDSEKSLFSRLRSRMNREQIELSQSERRSQDIKNRLMGSKSGIPSLESEKLRIEQKIKQLEKDAM